MSKVSAAHQSGESCISSQGITIQIMTNRSCFVRRGIKLLLLLIGSFYSVAGQNLKRHEILHPRYRVEWEVDWDARTVEFLITAETKGFVGFGLSHNGAMTGADIVVGGVGNNGQPYFYDFHGIGNKRPELDVEQNWELLSVFETENQTMLRFKRDWDTCDDEDVIIDGTVHLIWSLGETDELLYHGATRGGLAMNLLDPPLAPANLTTIAHEITKNYTLDGRVTAYWCSIHKRIPQNKTHIIAFKPKLETPEAVKYTHHFNVYVCKALASQQANELFDPLVDQDPINCFDKDFTLVKSNCTVNLYAWSFGGRLLTLPEDVGFPWGEEDVEYYYLETHVNNPQKLEGITFETGVQFYDTDQLREKEAAVMTLSYATSVSLFIPPNVHNWTLAGHASSHCINQYIPSTGIHLFNINLHAHASAKAMTFRHFRNGTELPWIAKDMHYDFNYQENRPLLQDVTVLPNDHLTIECVFDSTWKSPPYPIIGGYSSTDEMCMIFVFYYPRTTIKWISSDYPSSQLVGRYGITNITEKHETYPDLDPVIKDPEEWRGQKVTQILNSTVDWTLEEIASLQEEIRFGNHNDRCPEPRVDPKNKISGKLFLPLLNSNLALNGTKIPRMVSYPVIDKVYEEHRNCSGTRRKVPMQPQIAGADNGRQSVPLKLFYFLTFFLIFWNLSPI